MALVRGWLIRLVLLALLAGVGAAGYVLHHRVSPDQVRAAVLAELQARFPDAQVHVGAAGFRLFGGVTVHDLRVSRPGDDKPIFSAPVAVIAPDKERLGRGQVVLKRVELDRPTLRLDRRPDGTWGLPGMTDAPASDAPLPTVLATHATLLLSDQRPGGLPPLAVQASRVTLVNDPAQSLRFDGQFTVSPAADDKPAEGGMVIPFAVSGRVHRQTHAAHVRIEVPDLQVTPDLAPAAARLDPQLADLLSQVSARIALKADLATTGDPLRPVKADVRVEVRDGRFDDPALPWPAEQISASVRVADGRVTVEKGTARLGKAVATFGGESRPPAEPVVQVGGPKRYAPTRLVPVPAASKPGDPLTDAEARLDRYDLEVRGLALDEELFARLPPRGQKARRMFGPTGGIDLKVRFHRPAGGWTREFVVVPRGLGVVYEKFRYPVTDIAGEIRRVTDQTGGDEFRVDVTGSAGGRRVRCSGRVGTDGLDPLIELKLAGSDVPLDAALFAALPPKFAAIMTSLGATGRGDFTCDIRQPQDVNRCENGIRVKVYGGAVNYGPFPYPLAGVKGEIDVQVAATEADRPVRPGGPLGPVPDTDRVTLRGFEAVHGGGTLWLGGDSEPVPGTPDRRLRLRVQADKLPLDADLRAAVAKAKIERVWAALNPRGAVTFGAEVEVLDRGGAAPTLPPAPSPASSPGGVEQTAARLPGAEAFDPLRDLSLTVNLKGPTVSPGPLAYDLQDLAGVVQYQSGKVRLANLSAGHGAARFGVAGGEVTLAPAGGLFADLRGLSAKPLVLDADLRQALPERVRAALDAVNPRGPMELGVTHLVANLPADAAPTVYWNGELKFLGVTLDGEVPIENVVGAVGSDGRIEAGEVAGARANVWLQSLTVLGQPVTDARCYLQVRPPAGGAAPVLELLNLRAAVHGGFVGGTGRVTLDEAPRWRFDLLAGEVKLDQLARFVPLGGDATGVFQGRFGVENKPDPLTGRLVPVGQGKLEVLDARLLNLPVLMPLLKLLKLQQPDSTAFEEARATVVLTGDKLSVPQLDLIGSALCLGGSGEADLRGGDARFEFYTVWSQSLRRWLSTPLGDLSSVLSGNLFRIDLVRQGGKTTYQPHMLPAVTEPVRAVAGRLRDRLAGPNPTARAAAPAAGR